MKSVVEKALAKEKKKSKKSASKKGKSAVKTKNLDEVLKHSTPVIKVVGGGGAGNSTISRMFEVGIEGAETMAVNTDAQQLLTTHANEKILIGKKLTSGLGAGSQPEVGEAAAKESNEDIRKAVSGADLVFLTAGMGGGTGTGCLPVIAQIARDEGALTVAVVTLPFTVEGRRRMENALDGLEKLRKVSDTVILIPNDKLLEVAPDLPIKSAFKIGDEILTNAVKGTVELITKPGLINLDFADLKTVLARCGTAMIGLGESSKDSDLESRALDAIESALSSPLLDIDISEATRALVNVSGGSDMSLKEAEMVVEAVASKIHPNAHIIWGAMVEEHQNKNNVQTMVIIGGGKIPYIDAVSEATKEGGKNKADLDIGYV